MGIQIKDLLILHNQETKIGHLVRDPPRPAINVYSSSTNWKIIKTNTAGMSGSGCAGDRSGLPFRRAVRIIEIVGNPRMAEICA